MGKSRWLRFSDQGCQAWLNGIGVFEAKIATSFGKLGKSRLDYCDRMSKIEKPFFEYGVQKYGWHLAIKVALEHFNVMSRHDRMPLMPLNEVDSNLFIKT